MAINFPNSPLAGQVYEYGDYKYTYDGVKWTSVIKYSADSVKAHSSLAEIVADTKIVNGDWVKDLSTLAEYRIGTVGEIPLVTGLFATEIGLSDKKKAEVIAKAYGVAEDNVAVLKEGEVVGVNYFYDPVTEFTYHSSPALTGYLSDVGTDASGVRTIVVEGTGYSVTRM